MMANVTIDFQTNWCTVTEIIKIITSSSISSANLAPLSLKLCANHKKTQMNKQKPKKTKTKQKKNIAFTILYQCNVSQSIVSLNFRIEYRKLNASVNKNDATNGIHIL